MAHEVESMFTVGKKPWHNLGHVFETAPTTVEAAMEAAGLNWTVSKKPLWADVDGQLYKVPNHQSVMRDSDRKVLGVVGGRYTPLQNAAAFETFQPFLDAGAASFESAGSLRNGKRVWILARLTGEYGVSNDDAILPFVLLAHGHDGSLAIRYGLTPIRVVCANTLAMAQSSRESQLLKVRHTASARDTLERVTESINVAKGRFEATVAQYRALASKNISTKDLNRYFRVLNNVDPEAAEGKLSTKMKNKLSRLVGIFESGRGMDLKSAKGTYWGAYNAITEDLSHNAGQNNDNRYNTVWFGPDNRKALTTALQMSAA